MTRSEFDVEFGQIDSTLNRFALSLTRDVEDAKDLVQETVYRAFWNRGRFTVGTNFKAWMLTIMRNTFISSYRKRARSIVHAAREDEDLANQRSHAVHNQAPSNIGVEELQRAIDGLDALYRVPFTMFYTGYRYDEIATTLALPLGTVKSRIFFARRKLRALIDRAG